MLALYRRLIRLRAGSAALRHGRPVELTISDRRIYAAMRATDDEAVLVIANPTDAPLTGVRLSAGRTPIRADWTAHEEFEGAPIAAEAVSTAGGFADWSPFPELPPNSAYLVRWLKR